MTAVRAIKKRILVVRSVNKVMRSSNGVMSLSASAIYRPRQITTNYAALHHIEGYVNTVMMEDPSK